MSEVNIPMSAHKDSIMADQSEVRQMLDWVKSTFGETKGTEPSKSWNDSILMFLNTNVPFSFIYGGKPSSELLPAWKHSAQFIENDDNVVGTSQWEDPVTGLRVTASVKAYKLYPAVDWVLSFENCGQKDTPIIENIQALDIRLKTGDNYLPSMLHTLLGDDCSSDSFLPHNVNLYPGQSINLASYGGRSSSNGFPVFNFQHNDRGIIGAIGWTGQWAASFVRDAKETHAQAGMEKTHLLLHPGEKIRSPRILLMAWNGDLTAAHNRFRRLMLFNYSPKQNGKPVNLPIALQCFDRYIRTVPDWGTEKKQIEAAQGAYKLGCDTLWLDAGWFDRGFPTGVGTWHPEPNHFPNGLKPVSDACHKLGLEFLLWFEPERVASGSEIADEHPEYVLQGGDDGLFKLNAEEPLRWITDLLLKDIKDFGVDIYRNDFNFEPLEVWKANDAPDRQGMTEIRYIEGLYRMWDELREKNGGMLIDNCASGGRRIDIEMMTRSVPLWRSDTCCSPGRSDWYQAEVSGLSLYVPLHAGVTWEPTAYEFRSSSTAGIACQLDFMNPQFSWNLARQSIAEIKSLQKYWYGDFYPLTPVTISPEYFMAYQLDRPDLGEGVVYAFRRSECPNVGIIASLRGINSEARYSLEFVDESGTRTQKTITGRELIDGLDLRIPRKRASLVVKYKRL